MNYIFPPFFILFFSLTVLFAFYIPGRIFLNKKDFSFISKITTSLILGLVLWAWQGYIFGYLNIRWASYFYIGIFSIIYFIKGHYTELNIKKIPEIKKIDLIVLFIILFGVLGHNINYIRTGFIAQDGMITVISNQTDHFWHTSMINEMVKRIPPFEPGMFGIFKTNYHYWFNLITAELIRVFKLPLFQTQYLGMYPFGSLMLGLTAYVLSKYLYASKFFVRLTLFFFYFSSDAAYWLTYLNIGKLSFDIPSVIEHSFLFIDNPPRAFSVIITLCGLYLLFRYINKEFKNLIILALLFASLTGFKVYTAISVFAGLGILAIYRFVFKKDKRLVILIVVTALLSAIIYLPVNANAGGLFFLPFERQRDFITYKPLGFSDMELRWRIYEAHNNLIRLIQLGLQMTCIYLFAQFGLKLLGLIPNRKLWKILGADRLILMYTSILIPIFLGVFFSLKVHVSESYNLLIPIIIFLNILAPLNISLLLEKRSLAIKLIIILVITSLILPRWIFNIKNSFPVLISNKPVISNIELDTYKYLRNNTPENSLVMVFNKNHFDSISAIVGIFSQRRMFLSGQGVIKAHASVNEEREKIYEKITKTSDINKVNNLIKNNKIDYLLFYKSSINDLVISKNRLNAVSVYNNEYAEILKVE